MNVNTKNTKNQAQERNSEKLTRAELRRRQKAEAKMEKSKEKKKITVKSPRRRSRKFFFKMQKPSLRISNPIPGVI